MVFGNMTNRHRLRQGWAVQRVARWSEHPSIAPSWFCETKRCVCSRIQQTCVKMICEDQSVPAESMVGSVVCRPRALK